MEKKSPNPGVKATFRFGSTANIGKLGKRSYFKVNTQNNHINCLISWWLRNPNLPIFANRYTQYDFN